MDNSEERQQHIEDTKYAMWSDGMYVMLEDMECDYELAVIENSLRDSVYFYGVNYFRVTKSFGFKQLGVMAGFAGYWFFTERESIKLTRAQALYIATGDVSI